MMIIDTHFVTTKQPEHIHKITPRDEKIENSFSYHSPKGDQSSKYEILRQIAKGFAYAIESNVPNSREKSLAMTKLEEAVMWANKGIAINE